jgi:hypothetical protein
MTITPPAAPATIPPPTTSQPAAPVPRLRRYPLDDLIDTAPGRPDLDFVITKQHRRFAELGSSE